MSQQQKGKDDGARFAQFFLQQATKELSDDLNRVRSSDDFRVESVPFLVHALQQGASQLNPKSQQQRDSSKSLKTQGP